MAYSNIDVLESKTIKEPYDSTDCEGQGQAKGHVLYTPCLYYCPL